MPRRSRRSFSFTQMNQGTISSSLTNTQITSLSRHRDSMVSTRSRSSSAHCSVVTSHMDDNDTEMFSGAASNVVPTSISSFHHHTHFRSPTLSTTSSHDNDGTIDRIVLERSELQDINNITHSPIPYVINGHNYNDNDNNNLNDDENLDGYESEASDFHERSNFRFFKSEDIEAAKGVSSLGRFNADTKYESVKIDYDTNWNSFVDDYSTEYQSNTLEPHDRSMSVSSATHLNPKISYIGSNDSGSNSNNSYGSVDENPYSEFFRGDAERELIVDEEQDLPTYGEEGDETYEDIITKKAWLETTKKRESVKMHDKFFRKFPAKNKNQRFYIAEEDLVVGIAGYKTTYWKLIIYNLICISTLGFFALLCRWIPRWRIKMKGEQVPLAKAEWLVVEDEYGSLETPNVDRKWYNRNLSTFLPPKKVEHYSGENNTNNEDGEINEITTNDSKSHTESILTDVSHAYTIDDIDPIVPILISFEYRYMKLFYHPIDDLFMLSNNWIDEKWCHYPDIKSGITEANYKTRKMIFGDNIIEIQEKSVFKLLVDEVLHPFYVFQIFSIFLWLADNYYYYAFCIFLISVLSIAESLIETKSTFERMRKMSRFECDVRVWRSGFWKEINSDDLVPGDIYEVSDPSLSILPCDSILLTGDCIVNEAMLTGESVPVSKVPISNDSIKDIEMEFNSAKFSNKFSKSFLYNGTKLVRVRYGTSEESSGGGKEPATALVVRTGFNTTKGALIRSMLLPKPVGFKFYEDSFKYIGVMSLIACFGFIFSTINFIKLGLPWKVIILRALDLITIVVPPALPATLTIGTNFALNRLREKNIFCIAPMRVNVGGKIDVFCFDKTGTLTEEGLDIMGIHISNPIKDRKEHEFSDMLSSIYEILESDFENSDKLFTAMLTCHSLKIINDAYVGDPLDENMFQFVGWDMVEDPSTSHILNDFIDSRVLLTSSSPILFKKDGVPNYWIQLKEFEFISQLRRMSTICVNFSNNFNDFSDELEIYVKGAPEVIETICLPESIPQNYNELLYHYTHNGYRIIACASKKLKNPNKNKKDLSFIGDLKRESIESELEFIGFIVFENKMKDSTTNTITQLMEADLRTIMCTGDNILTAVSVGKECKIIGEGSKIFIPSFDYDNFPKRIEEDRIETNGQETEVLINGVPPIIWTEVDNPDLELDRITLSPLDINQDDNYCLAITGDIFKFILTELSDFEYYIETILMKSSIFARMSPDEKHELVSQLQKIDYTVGFCGDGANDCGALKAADVGISLSEAEASVAAPFTSRIFEISCVLDVIKEGRASLVTSFSCFQYMSLYSAIQFISVSILYKEGSNLGDFQFLYIDLALIIPIAIFMSWSKPYSKIVKKKPTANLISGKIIIPLLGSIFILFLGQFTIWRVIKNQHFSWYIPPVPGNDDEVQSTDNTTLFFYANFQYILIALMLTVGPPYREPANKNVPFIITVIVAFGVSIILMTINPETSFGQLMDLTWMSEGCKIGIVFGSFINYFILELGDKFVFVKLAQRVKRLLKRNGSNKRFKKLKKEFKKLV